MALGKNKAGRVGGIFSRARLGDRRLVRRAVGLAESLSQSPDRPLPKVWKTSAELEAGYRFLRSPRTDFVKLMEAIQFATREAALESRRVLVLHDTTDIECPSAQPEEVGFLPTGASGFFVHHALCVRDDETTRPLGMLWSQVWGRPQRSNGRARKLTGGALSKLDERESDRWLEGVSEAHLWAEGCEQVVHVMDREADSFRLFEHLQGLSADFVVRMRHDRCTGEGRLANELADSRIKLRRLVPLSPRAGKTMPRYTHKGRAAREAELVVRCTTVELQPPNYFRDSDPVEVNVVQILEEDAPKGATAIAWVLATSLPVKTRAQVEYVIDAYRARWQIEEFHKALKTGCMFEKRQLESFDSITSLLAICYPIACELLAIRSRAREAGVMGSEILRKSQLDCLRAHPHPRAQAMSADPTAEEAINVVAAIAGHISSNGPPGWQNIAAGYVELLAFERGWQAAMAAREL